MPDQPRQFEGSIEIAASPEAVWKALTDPEELKRWFPLNARVTPGPGGSIWLSWGGEWEGESRIEVWEPNRRLRLVEPPRAPFDIDGHIDPAAAEPLQIAIDYEIEGRGGTTRLRLVHSGFGSGAGWDDELDGVSGGWVYELRRLKDYLEHHQGQPRQVAWIRLIVALSRDAAWVRLVGDGGFAPAGALDGLEEGALYQFVSGRGESYAGTVLVNDPPRQFAGTIAALNGAMLRLSTEHAMGKVSVNVMLEAHDVAADTVESFRQRTRAFLDQIFATAPHDSRAH